MKEWMYDWGGLNVVLFHAINAHHAAWLDWIMLALTWVGDHDRFSAYLTVLALVTCWRYSRDPASPHTRAWVLALATLSIGCLRMLRAQDGESRQPRLDRKSVV